MVQTRHAAASGSGTPALEGNEQTPAGVVPLQAPPIDLRNFGAFMAAQTKMMYTTMNQIQNMNNQNSNNNHHNEAPVAHSHHGPSKLAEFMRTRLPTFSGYVSPVKADDWLRVVERKLLITQCSDHEKVLYATHHMQGIAAEWWENFCAAHETAQNITWEEFSTAFHQYHVPKGIIDLKKDEFRALK